ncbi:MAG: diacylglycerol kinase [Puniceicoccales bacterium]|nr:diacylglycerol kinase [Puniceicoccales bacterium]
MQRKISRRLFRLCVIFLWRYIVNPLSYSISGMRFMRHERPFRVELVCGIVILPICFWFLGWSWKFFLLVVDFFILLIAECLNTAVESVVNFSSQNKKFPLAKKAKDTASAAVYIALCNIVVSAIFIITVK